MIQAKYGLNHYYQKGATLIVVLFLLIIITLIGTYAIKISTTSLAISTNAQINQLLIQSADTPLNLYRNTSDLKKLVSYSTAVGAALDETEANREFIFCYKPTVNRAFGLNADTSVIKPKDGAAEAAELANGSGVTGFCDITRDFGSARQAVVTQVAVTIPKEKDDTRSPGDHLTRGTNIATGSGLPKNLVSRQTIRVTATAFLPSYANTSLPNVQTACLSSNGIYLSDNLNTELSSKKTLVECLNDFNIPAVTQVQEFTLGSYLEQTQAP